MQGSDLIIFEVNGWHNLVHIASGLLGIALARRNDTARLFALGFGAVYLLVTIYGFADGNDVIGLLPINTPTISCIWRSPPPASPPGSRPPRRRGGVPRPPDLERRKPRERGAFEGAPKRTRTSTRLSRTRPSAL